jgi:hypothetical protein
MKRNDSTIKKCVHALLARRRRLRFLRVSLVTGSVLSFLLALALLAFVVLRPVSFTGWARTEIITLGLAGLGGGWVFAIVAGGISALLTRFDSIGTAKCLDDRYGYKDQVASAFALADVDREFAIAARERAQEMVKSSKPREVFPLPLSSGIPRLAALTAVALILLIIASSLLFKEDLSAAEMRKGITALARKLRRYAVAREKEARTDEEKEILERLKRLAEQLKKKKITKKEALEQAASLRKALGKKAQKLSMKGLDLRKAAEALSKCKDTKPIARELRRRSVKGAAHETRKLSEAIAGRKTLRENLEFEKLSDAFRKAAPHMGPFGDTSRKVARASKFYERGLTAEELKKLAEQLKRDAKAAELSDLLQGSMRELQQLQEGLGQLREFKQGKGAQALRQFMQPGQGKGQQGPGRPGRDGKGRGRQQGRGQGRTLGSLRNREKGPGVGRGTDPNLLGKATERKKDRDPYLMKPSEGKGKSDYFQVKSARELAKSEVDYKNIFVNYKRLAENTLYNEQVPIGYREYVRKYFENIRPEEGAKAQNK